VARKEPISEVCRHHRALSTYDLSVIAARLSQTIKWDPKKEQVVGDSQALALVAREAQRV
jgi:hypothetical protein